MSDKVATALRALVRERARHRCEYCRIHEEDALLPHEIDHIQARKHHGETREENLAWACFACNGFKGSDIASIEVETGQIVPLFYPRKDTWSRHFRLEGGRILPADSKGPGDRIRLAIQFAQVYPGAAVAGPDRPLSSIRELHRP